MTMSEGNQIMKVTEAVIERSSVRAFTDAPVDAECIRDMLAQSSRSASGGNLQPWRIYVINKNSMDEFLTFQQNWSQPEVAPYEIYPSGLKELF